MSDLDLDDLRNELADFAQPEKKVQRSAKEERVIAGFEEIQRFVDQNGRAPLHGEDRDIFERLYAVRLDRLRGLSEYHELLMPLDHQSLLTAAEPTPSAPVENMDDDELLAELDGAAPISHSCAMSDRLRRSAPPRKLPTANGARILTGSNRYSMPCRPISMPGPEPRALLSRILDS